MTDIRTLADAVDAALDNFAVAAGARSVSSLNAAAGVSAGPLTRADIRERRRKVFICSSKSDGLLAAARATSKVTSPASTRSIRHWSNVCMPY